MDENRGEGIYPRSTAPQSQKTLHAVYQAHRGRRFWGCCAAQRGWIPSPQWLPLPSIWGTSHRHTGPLHQ